MENKKSETLEQRKKAQRDFLELKKMQAGEIAPEAHTEPELPKTFSDKAKNYWYHYKVHTILGLFLAMVIAICVTQCATRPKYDAEIVLYTRHSYSPQQIDLLTEYMKQFFTDFNGDGEVNIAISDCSYNTEGLYDLDQNNAHASKLHASIAQGVEAQLYILDDDTYADLNETYKDYGGFIIQSVPLPEDITELKDDQGFTFPEGLIIGRRVLKATAMEDNEVAIKASEDSKTVLEAITEYSK